MLIGLITLEHLCRKRHCCTRECEKTQKNPETMTTALDWFFAAPGEWDSDGKLVGHSTWLENRYSEHTLSY